MRKAFFRMGRRRARPGLRDEAMLSLGPDLPEPAATIYARRLIILSLIVLAGLLVWAAIAPLEERARAEGVIIPQGGSIPLQHDGGGIVEMIFVDRGTEVVKGMPILTLQDPDALSERRRLEVRASRLAVEEEIHRALLEDRVPEYPDTDPIVLSDAQASFAAMKAAAEEQRLLLSEGVAQAEEGLSATMIRYKDLLLELEASLDEQDRLDRLAAKGLVAGSVAVETRRRAERLRADAEELAERVAVAQRAADEARARRATAMAENTQSLTRALTEITGTLEDVKGRIGQISERMDRQVIRAPAAGVIDHLDVNSAGAVVPPGAPVATLVPTDRPIQAQIRIRPRDIAHVEVGDPVSLQVSSFDLGRYGSASGKLLSISPITTVEESGAFFTGLVVLDRPFMGSNEEWRIRTGMQVSAEIVTGRRTALSYLLKPVQLSLHSAMSER